MAVKPCDELFECDQLPNSGGVITSGMTVTDIWSAKKYPEKNAEVMLEVDREAFIRVFKDLLERI
jgi:inosine-uridine nucleoside N-ribohydrolase